MTDLDSGYDEQDQSEVLDEDNIEVESQRYGERGDESVFEALPDVLDVTQAIGDEDDDDAEIGEDLDDEELVALARDSDDDRGDGAGYPEFEDDLDAVDRADAHARNEVELEYRGDLADLEGAASAAQALEADTLSDSDLRELDYKDEFTIDEDEPRAPAR